MEKTERKKQLSSFEYKNLVRKFRQRGFDPDSINSFFKMSEHYCRKMRRHVPGRKTPEFEKLSSVDYEAKIRDMHKVFKHASRYINQLAQFKILLGHHGGSWLEPHQNNVEFASKGMVYSNKIKQPLDLLIETIETQIKETKTDRKPWRPSGSLRDSFVYKLAQVYYMNFGTIPKSTKDGDFMAFVESALEIVWLPHGDPTRSVLKAIQRLKGETT